MDPSFPDFRKTKKAPRRVHLSLGAFPSKPSGNLFPCFPQKKERYVAGFISGSRIRMLENRTKFEPLSRPFISPGVWLMGMAGEDFSP